METPPDSSWLESCYEAEGPFYQCTMSLLLHTPTRWKTYRIAHLNRLIVLAHQRYVSPSGPTKSIVDVTVKHYAVYKSALIFFGLVNCIYANFFKVLSSSNLYFLFRLILNNSLFNPIFSYSFHHRKLMYYPIISGHQFWLSISDIMMKPC